MRYLTPVLVLFAEGVIRALKACPGRSEGRRLGEDASPEGLIASFRTRVVAEPAL